MNVVVFLIVLAVALAFVTLSARAQVDAERPPRVSPESLAMRSRIAELEGLARRLDTVNKQIWNLDFSGIDAPDLRDLLIRQREQVAAEWSAFEDRITAELSDQSA